MLILTVAVLIIGIPILVLGILYVPLHDGRPFDLLLAVLLPTTAVCWSLWQLVTRCRRDNKPDGGGKIR